MLNLFFTIIFIYILSLIVAVVDSYAKMVLHRVFDYVTDQRIRFEYIIFYSIGFTFIIMISYHFNDFLLIFIGFLVMVVAEILVFYKRHYSIESKKRYALFMFATAIINYMIAEVAIVLFMISSLALGFLMQL